MAISTSKITMIVPCAGYGTRMGSPPAKELLINPETQAPLIEYCLKLADQNQWNTVLITRHEKKVLMDYVSHREVKKNLKTQWVLVQNTLEWPDSILKSYDFWSENNIMILPDTTWSPLGIENDVLKDLDHCDVSFGVFEATDKKTWGTVAISKENFQICEKPQKQMPDYKAWGLIAFKKNIGRVLFSSILESTQDHQVKTLQLKARTTSLNSFKDLTRIS